MNALEEALYDQLAGGTALAAAVGTQFFRSAAPPEAEHPFVIYQLQSGGDENATGVDSLDLRYGVRAVSAASADEAGDLDDLIRARLHRATLSVSGWNNCWTTREAEIRTLETDASGKQFWHAGAVYRIRLDKS